jgi:hypothetical protein
MENPRSKPTGVKLVTILLLSASMGFGFLGMFFFALSVVGGAGLHSYFIPSDALWLIIFSFLFAFFTFSGFIILATNRQPPKGGWYFLNALWVFMIVFFGWAIFTDNPYAAGYPNLPLFVGIYLVCLVYSLVCALYFQTAQVKEYFHLKQKSSNN